MLSLSHLVIDLTRNLIYENLQYSTKIISDLLENILSNTHIGLVLNLLDKVLGLGDSF